MWGDDPHRTGWAWEGAGTELLRSHPQGPWRAGQAPELVESQVVLWEGKEDWPWLLSLCKSYRPSLLRPQCPI